MNMNRLIKRRIGFLSLLLLLTPKMEANSRPGTPDHSFNPGGPVQGYTVQPMSSFLDIASAVGLQKCKDSYKIIVAGDAVAKPQPLENISNGCATPNITDCPTPDTTCPNDCSGNPGTTCLHCTIDGYQDERVRALVRLNCDGSVDNSFGPNGNGKVYTDIAPFANTSGGIDIDDASRILFGVNLYLSPASIFDPADPNYGTTGFPSNDACGFTNAFYKPGVYYFTTAIGVTRYTKDGLIDSTYGTGGTFSLIPTIFPVNSFGDAVTEVALDKKDRLYVVGQTFPDSTLKPNDPTNGCSVGYPIILRLTQQGQLDSANFNSSGNPLPGVVVEGTIPPGDTSFVTTFIDNSQSQTLNIASYNALAIHTNDSKLKGKIVTVGDGDVNSLVTFYPFTARVIVARYNEDGSLDTSFGVGGRMVISGINAGKQLLARAIAIDKYDNIYLGGDIADIGSGSPGAVTPPAPNGVGQVIARVSANFLIIKLDKNGIPQDFGPLSGCSAAGSPCQTTVFNSCASCSLNYNQPSGLFGSFRAVTTDFKGFDDAVFGLVIDNCNCTLTAVGQASQDAGVETQSFGLARYHLKNGNLDKSFGTGGLSIVNSPLSFRSLARAAVLDNHGDIVTVGQSASGPLVTTTNFQDATSTNFAVARIHGR